MKKLLFVAFVIGATTIFAQENTATSRPDAHAPIGVMGDHTHKKGEVMFSYRYMTMQMEDTRSGTEDLSLEEVITTPNRFGVPPTLRVVPTSMQMDMHMVGVMYAVSDKLTLMGMAMVLSNSMDHTTFQGMTGTNVLGEFNTESSGLGDTRIAALYKISGNAHLNLGLSIPTGSVTEEDDVLAPTGMRPTLRLPYPMQLGSGTWDLTPGITYASRNDKLGWGGQTTAVIRLGENKHNYSLGHSLNVTAWGSYLLTDWLSSSFRFSLNRWQRIDGIDPVITAPVQTAHPEFMGGTRLDGLVGLNAIGQSGFTRNQRLAVEFGIPFIQDFLNGPQLKVASTLTVGWQYAL